MRVEAMSFRQKLSNPCPLSVEVEEVPTQLSFFSPEKESLINADLPFPASSKGGKAKVLLLTLLGQGQSKRKEKGKHGECLSLSLCQVA